MLRWVNFKLLFDLGFQLLLGYLFFVIFSPSASLISLGTIEFWALPFVIQSFSTSFSWVGLKILNLFMFYLSIFCTALPGFLTVLNFMDILRRLFTAVNCFRFLCSDLYDRSSHWGNMKIWMIVYTWICSSRIWMRASNILLRHHRWWNPSIRIIRKHVRRQVWLIGIRVYGTNWHIWRLIERRHHIGRVVWWRRNSRVGIVLRRVRWVYIWRILQLFIDWLSVAFICLFSIIAPLPFLVILTKSFLFWLFVDFFLLLFISHCICLNSIFITTVSKIIY